MDTARCANPKCNKRFDQRTSWQLYCSDTCRAAVNGKPRRDRDRARQVANRVLLAELRRYLEASPEENAKILVKRMRMLER